MSPLSDHAGIKIEELDLPPLVGGWTIRQIVHHIVDGDDLWKACIKAALGNERGEFSLGWYWSLPQQVRAKRWVCAHRYWIRQSRRSGRTEIMSYDSWNTCRMHGDERSKFGSQMGKSKQDRLELL